MRKSLILLALFIQSCNSPDKLGGELLFFEANPEKGYHFPYYLFIPDGIDSTNTVIMMVEPNNSGFVSDNIGDHIEKAKRIASLDYYAGNFVARALKVPLLVPVFSRPDSSPNIYSHALDRDVMLQKDNPLERVDLQLLSMVEDATGQLKRKGIKVDERFMMTGFSASGTFANRFSIMHPERISAVAVGGVNGLLMLPLETLNGKLLTYPVGVGDFNEIINASFHYEEFSRIPQFVFMGSIDDNDAIPFADGYDSTERSLIFDLLGEKMMPDRWNRCMELYDSLQINVTFRTYEDIGHAQPETIKQELVKFFSKKRD